MIKILYLHDLFHIYPEYIPEMHWCCMKLGESRNPPVNMLVSIAVAKVHERLYFNKNLCNWIEALYHVLNHTIKIRIKYDMVQLPFKEESCPF